jgi:hypothetical protein
VRTGGPDDPPRRSSPIGRRLSPENGESSLNVTNSQKISSNDKTLAPTLESMVGLLYT